MRPNKPAELTALCSIDNELNPALWRYQRLRAIYKIIGHSSINFTYWDPAVRILYLFWVRITASDTMIPTDKYRIVPTIKLVESILVEPLSGRLVEHPGREGSMWWYTCLLQNWYTVAILIHCHISATLLQYWYNAKLINQYYILQYWLKSRNNELSHFRKMLSIKIFCNIDNNSFDNIVFCVIRAGAFNICIRWREKITFKKSRIICNIVFLST